MGWVYIVGREFFRTGKTFLDELRREREVLRNKSDLVVDCEVSVYRKDERLFLVYSNKKNYNPWYILFSFK